MDSRDSYPYQALLDELLFHSEMRFKDYKSFQAEGEFPERLKKWLDNFGDDRRKKILFQLLRWVTFVDRDQMLSLYRDAFRRVLSPWLAKDLSTAQLLDPNYEITILALFREYQILSITDSFNFPDFLHINDLIGLVKPVILGEDPNKINQAHLQLSSKGAIVLEDFVGTGKQAGSVMKRLAELAPPNWRIIFIPLIALEQGVDNLKKALNPLDIAVEAGLVIRRVTCINESPTESEPPEFVAFRTLIKKCSARVLERTGPQDDPPTNCFGYKGCGSLLVTCNNAPNNSLPLLHHRAPQWNPLFRRVHHSKDHL